jgi:hypothetical protein
VRIVINGPPKQGHRWFKCILSHIYNLEVLGGRRTPENKPAAVREWVDAGAFPDHTIYHQHIRFSRKLVDALDRAPAHLVTVVRDPYDAFVSLYYWTQDRAAHEEGAKKERRRHALVGKPLDDPAVLAYLADQFAENIMQAHEWLHSGRAMPVRYEGLHRDPVAETRRVTDLISPVSDERIERALAYCSAENMRQRSEKLSRHVRSGTVGDSKQRLTEAHLEIFRERYADVIRSLGYEVR